MPISQSLLAIACGTLLVGTALAKEPTDPKEQPDESWICLSGTVRSASADSFILEYKGGTITVEMDDNDPFAEGTLLNEGNEVTVFGRVDDDLFQTTTIEASAVYVEDLNTFFYASSEDEEDTANWSPAQSVTPGETMLRGTVSSTDPDTHRFTIDTGTRRMIVETDGIGYNPYDAIGYQKIEVGDRVSVNGAYDHELFDGRILEADSVVTLHDVSK
ncbi:MAG: NirD/YgiW/YdeI family stress tolerance protein [Planctomycetota bacterium]|jgi:uncharacterized protein YdeI (BOF family)|nr:NirD/YgiW/YdeI family stress tolerance protein [Planctomycetota bacterium]